jgi:DNA-binding response OmpR family regulator
MVQVMVVEKDRLIRDLLVDVLRRKGFLVIAAGSADAAVLLLHLPIEVLVTDVSLPGVLNGIDLAKAARGLSPDLPIVFISGWPDNSRDVQGISDPVSVLSKPFSLSTFATAVRAVTPIRLADRLMLVPN